MIFQSKIVKWTLLLGSVAWLPVSTTLGGNWPQWRGPNRNGDVPDFQPPKTWPKQLKMNWRVTVGEGHSSPIVSDGRVYIVARQGNEEVVRCLELASGESIWEAKYPAPYKMNPAAMKHGKGPKSTPLVQDGKLITFSIHGVLSCFDATTGKLAWRKDYAEKFMATSPAFGTAMSPIVVDGMCIAHFGGKNQNAMAAFDLHTGEERWSLSGFGPAYTSPILVNLAGQRQIVTHSRRFILGISPESGKLLWKISCVNAYDENAVTTVLFKDTLIYSALRNPIIAIRLVKEGPGLMTSEIWKNKDLPMYMSSPVLDGKWLFGMTHKRKGQVFCLDATTGQVAWRGPDRAGENIALIKAGPVIFLQTDAAELRVIEANEKAYRELAMYKVADSPTWAHPAIVDNTILIKDKTNLTAYSLSP